MIEVKAPWHRLPRTSEASGQQLCERDTREAALLLSWALGFPQGCAGSAGLLLSHEAGGGRVPARGHAAAALHHCLHALLLSGHCLLQGHPRREGRLAGQPMSAKPESHPAWSGSVSRGVTRSLLSDHRMLFIGPQAHHLKAGKQLASLAIVETFLRMLGLSKISTIFHHACEELS